MNRPRACYLFSKTPLPKTCTGEINSVILQLQKLQTKEQYLKGAYDFITTRYESKRLDTAFKLFGLYSTSLENLWNRKGFMHCTNQNYLLAMLLVRGGLFAESDIKPQWALVDLCPHQYLKIKLHDGQWVEVDCWGRHYGIGFGNHAHGFNATLRKSFVA